MPSASFSPRRDFLFVASLKAFSRVSYPCTLWMSLPSSYTRGAVSFTACCAMNWRKYDECYDEIGKVVVVVAEEGGLLIGASSMEFTYYWFLDEQSVSPPVLVGYVSSRSYYLRRWPRLISVDDWNEQPNFPKKCKAREALLNYIQIDSGNRWLYPLASDDVSVSDRFSIYLNCSVCRTFCVQNNSIKNIRATPL